MCSADAEMIRSGADGAILLSYCPCNFLLSDYLFV
jgi:hypothetical protein